MDCSCGTKTELFCVKCCKPICENCKDTQCDCLPSNKTIQTEYLRLEKDTDGHFMLPLGIFISIYYFFSESCKCFKYV